MEASSKELRREVLAASAAGETTRPIALRWRVSESWCRRVQQEFREHGKTAPCTTRKRTPKWAEHADRIRELVPQRPDISWPELQAAFPTRFGQSTLSNALAALKLSWKKSDPRSRAGSPRCRPTANGMAGPTTRSRPRPPRLSR